MRDIKNRFNQIFITKRFLKRKNIDKMAKVASTIWKYQLDMTDYQAIEMPEGAEILSVQNQNGSAMLWAMVDPEAPKETRAFRVAGTGHPLDDKSETEFISTFQMHGGQLVFHAFEYK